MATLAQQKKELEEKLKIAYEVTDSQHKIITELTSQVRQAVESSPIYQQALTDAENARKDCQMWKDLYTELSAKYDKLKIDYQTERVKADHLSTEAARIDTSDPSDIKRNTERYMTIPNAPRRGARRKADAEARQYIHELRKYNNSLQSIADLTGMSKTQVHAILKEPEYVGKWYSVINGQRFYYDDYPAAVNSQEEIHFEIIPNDIPNSVC